MGIQTSKVSDISSILHITYIRNTYCVFYGQQVSPLFGPYNDVSRITIHIVRQKKKGELIAESQQVFWLRVYYQLPFPVSFSRRPFKASYNHNCTSSRKTLVPSSYAPTLTWATWLSGLRFGMRLDREHTLCIEYHETLLVYNRRHCRTFILTLYILLFLILIISFTITTLLWGLGRITGEEE